MLALAKELAENCTFSIVMVDDRKHSTWHHSLARKRFNVHAPYWVLSGALNFAYASLHGYGFRYVRPKRVRTCAKAFQQRMRIGSVS
eukprot:1658209-Amphidinium_carterae.1